MHSNKHIEWQDYFKQGVNVISPEPITYEIQSYRPGDTIKNPFDYEDSYKTICLSERFNIAPKLIDAGIHKANRLFKYYTFKQLPGAVIFLGCK